MKRSLLLGIVAFATAASTSHGQGGIVISNYQAPYNRMLWLFGPRAGLPVLSTEGVNLSIWYGEGVLAANQLLLNVPVAWNTQSESSGYAGYYGPVNVSLPGWSAGETWTFQVRASGNSVFGFLDPNNPANWTVTWTESVDIADIGGIPPNPPGISHNSIGTPEPSAFALTGLGLSGWMFFRRRAA